MLSYIGDWHWFRRNPRLTLMSFAPGTCYLGRKGQVDSIANALALCQKCRGRQTVICDIYLAGMICDYTQVGGEQVDFSSSIRWAELQIRGSMRLQ